MAEKANKLLRRERCPECAKVGKDISGDNLAVYSDGHEYCYNCGYLNTREVKTRRPPATKVLQTEEEEALVMLPVDVTSDIPTVALDWLKTFDLSLRDTALHGIMWSPSKSMLIFPYEDAWQGRYFGLNEKHPKWYNRGNLDNLIHGYNLEKRDQPIVLVEDIVSAIRIGRLGFPVVCLFGCHVSNSKVTALAWEYERLIFWLDYDKRAAATQQATRLGDFMDARPGVIVTKLDPKCLKDSEIRDILMPIEKID